MSEPEGNISLLLSVKQSLTLVGKSNPQLKKKLLFGQHLYFNINVDINKIAFIHTRHFE